MKYADQYFTLSTGQKFYAHNGILGLSAEQDDTATDFIDSPVYKGYDGIVMNKFTRVERVEIVTYMIELWELWEMQP